MTTVTNGWGTVYNPATDGLAILGLEVVMAEKLHLRNRVLERPLSHWRSIAVELLGSQTHIIQGERWHHRVVERGHGLPLFLYHGIGGHIDTYARTLPAWAKHFRTFAIDALYHGFSSREPWEPERRTPLQAEA